MLRVGRIKYDENWKKILPHFDDFTPIVIIAGSPYSVLSTYELRDENGCILENIWRFSEVYRSLPQVAIPYTVSYPKIIWRWPAEIHINAADEPTDEYWRWREAGMRNSHAVHHPAGKNKDHEYSIKERGGDHLDNIEARKKIHIPSYIDLARKNPKFDELKTRLDSGENLLIIDVDGPVEDYTNVYKHLYDVDDDFIIGDTMLATLENLRIMCGDDRHRFGQGYCLAMALMDIGPEML